MHFPRYWKLTNKGGVFAWGWSDVSAEDAEADGLKRVDRIIEWLRTGMRTERGEYGYPNSPMREEVVREFLDTQGQASAVVSRNSYGCLVLNTQRMLFVDVDERSRGLFGALSSLFGGGFEKQLLAEVQKWIAAHPDWGWRVYRTRAGIRLLATHQTISPEDALCAKAFKTFRADWLYQKLCVNQKCFRARITPKPWRCGVEKPKFRWPYPNDQDKWKFQEWSERYQNAIGGHAVCRLLGHFGKSEIHHDLRDLVAFHDTATRVETSLPPCVNKFDVTDDFLARLELQPMKKFLLILTLLAFAFGPLMPQTRADDVPVTQSSPKHKKHKKHHKKGKKGKKKGKKHHKKYRKHHKKKRTS